MIYDISQDIKETPIFPTGRSAILLPKRIRFGNCVIEWTHSDYSSSEGIYFIIYTSHIVTFRYYAQTICAHTFSSDGHLKRF